MPIENLDISKPGELTIFGKLQSTNSDDKVSRFKIKAQFKSPTKDELFIAINRFVSPGRYQRVYKTETIPAPFDWNPIEIETDMLCNDTDTDQILIQLYKYQLSGDHVLKSEQYVTNAKLKKGKMTLDGGKGCTIVISDYVCEQKSTFLNFIFGGCDINISMGIDFSYSINDERVEEIKQAISLCMETLHYYDSD